MNDWRSKTGKHAERVRQEAERAKQASLEAYRKALKSIRTRAPELRAKLPSNREGWVRAGLIAVAVLICLVVSGSGVMAGMALAFNRKLPDVSALYAPPDQGGDRRALSQSSVLWQRRLWRGDGGAGVLRQVGGEFEPGRKRDVGRHHPLPVNRDTVPEPGAGQGAAADGAPAHGRFGLHHSEAGGRRGRPDDQTVSGRERGPDRHPRAVFCLLHPPISAGAVW